MFNFTETIDRTGKDAIAYDAQAAMRGFWQDPKRLS